jgi:hypothetical protein
VFALTPKPLGGLFVYSLIRPVINYRKRGERSIRRGEIVNGKYNYSIFSRERRRERNRRDRGLRCFTSLLRAVVMFLSTIEVIPGFWSVSDLLGLKTVRECPDQPPGDAPDGGSR